MKVSALIPTYNRVWHVQRAIDSVLVQTKPVNEIVVVDDGSTDDTAEVLAHKYGSRIQLILQTHSGVSVARRRAVQEAKGDWIAFLDSDDEWTPLRNQLFCSVFDGIDERVAWIFGDVGVVRDDGSQETIFQKHGLELHQTLTVFQDPLQVQFPFQYGLLPGSVIKRGALLRLDCFSDGLQHSEDFLAGIQVALNYKFAAVRDIVTKVYRTQDLRGSSAERQGRNGPDYYRARMKAFRLVIESGRSQPWGDRYADAVRGLCKFYAEEGWPIRTLALQQFRFGFSPASIGFFCCAMLGSRFVQACRRIKRNLAPRPNESPQFLDGL